NNVFWLTGPISCPYGTSCGWLISVFTDILSLTGQMLVASIFFSVFSQNTENALQVSAVRHLISVKRSSPMSTRPVGTELSGLKWWTVVGRWDVGSSCEVLPICCPYETGASCIFFFSIFSNLTLHALIFSAVRHLISVKETCPESLLVP